MTPNPGDSTARPTETPTRTREVPAFDVPDGEPVLECPYCERPFVSQHLRDLHVGERHPDSCTETEREAAAEATDAELDELFVFHIKVVATLTLLYAALVLIYMVVLAWG
jgi:hypothetical protein